jgi:hypothetical protein
MEQDLQVYYSTNAGESFDTLKVGVHGFIAGKQLEMSSGGDLFLGTYNGGVYVYGEGSKISDELVVNSKITFNNLIYSYTEKY